MIIIIFYVLLLVTAIAGIVMRDWRPHLVTLALALILLILLLARVHVG